MAPYLDPDYKLTTPDADYPWPNLPYVQELARKIEAALPDHLSVPVAKKRRILVITHGVCGNLHAIGAAGCLKFLRSAAKKYGVFELTEIISRESVNAEMLSGFDAVVLNNNTGEPFDENDEEVYNKLLPDYVRNGGGLFSTHGTIEMHHNPRTAELFKVLGAYSGGHPGTKPEFKGKWGAVSGFAWKLNAPDNPLAAAFVEAMHQPPTTYTFAESTGSIDKATGKVGRWTSTFTFPQKIADELYRIGRPESLKDNKDNAWQCIVSLDRDKCPEGDFNVGGETTDVNYSLIWTNAYGKGRAYVTQFGHYPDIFSIPAVSRALLDGLLYATGDLKIPASDGATAKP